MVEPYRVPASLGQQLQRGLRHVLVRLDSKVDDQLEHLKPRHIDMTI